MFKSGVKSKRVKSGRKKYKIIEIPEFKKRKIMWSPFPS